MSSLQARLGGGLSFPRYAKAPGLWIVVPYFNPAHYKTRRANYETFAFSMRNSGIPILTVECAFGDDEFDLPEALDVVHIRSASVLWQKERLLNLAASWLPDDCTAIAWVDADVLFQNKDWAVETMVALEKNAIVQLFEECVRLDQGNVIGAKVDRVRSFGSICPQHPELISCGNFEKHGHTGYAWAMRREIFRDVGLYEYAVCGTGDHMMAHAVYNDHGFCIHQSFKGEREQMAHFREWSQRFHKAAGERFTAISGTILHMWHGSDANRQYLQRMYAVTDLGFNPYDDIIARPGKPLEWHPDMKKDALRRYFLEYFKSRREDG